MTQATGSEDGEGEPVTVHRLPLTDEAVAGIEALAGALGLRVLRVDFRGCSDKAGLLERASSALAFPSWFGHNWDAWFDCLTDLAWQPPAAGYVLVMRHVDELERTTPEALDTALAIVEDAARVWAGRGVRLLAFVDAGA